MPTQFKIDNERLNIYEMEHYILHMLSELNSKRNDGWVEEHYRNELQSCGKVIDEYLESLNQQMQMEETKDWVNNYENEKLSTLRKRIDEV